jgi:TetR/AcrR family transcriptional regulator, regulator of cefoperazone and chloramphenicol sensitivity
MNDLAPRPSTPGAARSERGGDTRQRLLEAAIEVFGRQGFEAGTRALVAHAGVNLAAIPYHFGSKQGLYLAAADHIAAQIGERVGPAVARAQGRLRDGPLDREGARALLFDLLEAFARMLVRPESAAWARFIVREQMEPTAAFERLYEGFIGRAFATITLLIGRISGEDAASETVRLKAVALVGQVLVLRAARTTVLRQLGWSEVGEAEFAAIRGLIRRALTAIEEGGG